MSLWSRSWSASIWLRVWRVQPGSFRMPVGGGAEALIMKGPSGSTLKIRGRASRYSVTGGRPGGSFLQGTLQAVPRWRFPMADQDDKNKPEKQQSGGRPGTKFMERPKPGQQKDPTQQQQGNIPP